VDRNLLRQVRAALAASELARDVSAAARDAGAAFALGREPLRPLFPQEVARLENLGNSCDDWSRVRVAAGFDCERVKHSSFHGDVVLGRFTASVRLAAGLEVPTGVYHSTVANCALGNDALVRGVGLLANYAVGEGALLWNCGSVGCEGPTTFGNGAVLPVGLESRGREVAVYAEITVEAALALARARGDAARAYREALTAYLHAVRSGRGVIGPAAVVRDTPRVWNVYVGPCARVEGATLVEESTLLSGAGESSEILSGACVTGALLQWGSRVASLAVVERSVLAEYAHVERHAKVQGSILGPNTAVAQGEVTASLLGPFVAAHHQSLLIAVLWPEGKGNISHGASVGCNHTSRAPDQECRPGEGMFFGLGVNVKFPADFSEAPYSVVACGATTLPQKVRFPFALINLPSAHWPGVSPAYNQITPAWMLTDNLYALKRNEAKYRARNRARRAALRFELFRPDTVDLMRDACRRLEAVPQVRELYTDRDIEGLGANVLAESARLRAVEAYRFFIRLYALLGLKDVLAAAPPEAQAGPRDGMLARPSADPRWEHQRRLLTEELGVSDVAAALRELPALLEKVARGVERSRAKDEERGRRVLDDYAQTHVPAHADPFVKQTWAETRKAQAEVEGLLSLLEAAREEGHMPSGPPGIRPGTAGRGPAGPAGRVPPEPPSPAPEAVPA
jgi:hypothetical protein